MEGRMLRVLKQEHRLFIERFLHGLWGLTVTAGKVWRESERHRARRFGFLELTFFVSLWRAATNCLCVANGPNEWPALNSAMLSATPRSTMDFGSKTIFPF